MEQQLTKPNYIEKVLSGLIDAALVLGFYMMIAGAVNFFVMYFIYRLLTIYLFNSTLGMQVFRMTFLNAEEEKLSAKEKVLASIFILFEGVDYYKIVKAYH